MTALEEYEECAELVDPKHWGSLHVTADAAIESLKCCGNCEWRDCELCEESCVGLTAQLVVNPADPCHFTPSRWQERKP